MSQPGFQAMPQPQPTVQHALGAPASFRPGGPGQSPFDEEQAHIKDLYKKVFSGDFPINNVEFIIFPL